MRTFLFSILFSSFTLWLVSCSGDSGENQAGRQGMNRAPTVEAVKVITGSLPLEERMTGIVTAHNQTDIYPEISAPIVEVLAQNGDHVQKGDILVRLRDTEAKERLRQAEAGYQIARARVRQAEADLNRVVLQQERIKRLYDRQMETASELERIEADAEAARANLELQEAQLNQALSVIEERKTELEHTTIRAPIDGLVGLRNAEVGQQANNSRRLFQIGDPTRIKVEVVLTESMTSYINIGQTAIVSSSGNDGVVESQVTRISPFLNPVTHTTTAEIEIDNTERLLRPGMFVNIAIHYGESEQAVLIPNNALFYHPTQRTEGVFLASPAGSELQFDGETPDTGLLGPVDVTFVPVTTEAKGRMITGVSGIPNDSWVVSLGQNLLLRGSEQAFVRPVEWDHIINLQELHSRDLFEMIQKKLADQAAMNGTGV
ncbi:efflux RND transporter periplasmic adaptor subunit [Balneolaceae bacterium ANBcel3]|nr:efflux RND transporter periplasmic adaptor subunit [Balneolaceae bacterium ANBcel3]